MGLLENTIGAMLGHKSGEGSGRPSMGGSPYAPLATALIAMLAAKAATGGFGDLGGLLGDGNKSAAPAPQPGGQQPQATPENTAGGGLLGGLGGLLNHFQQGGAGDLMNSWIGHGQNAPASPHQITQALGPDNIRELAQRTGTPENEVASQLSEQLPQVVDKLTPQGRLPTHDEVSAWH